MEVPKGDIIGVKGYKKPIRGLTAVVKVLLRFPNLLMKARNIEGVAIAIDKENVKGKKAIEKLKMKAVKRVKNKAFVIALKKACLFCFIGCLNFFIKKKNSNFRRIFYIIIT